MYTCIDDYVYMYIYTARASIKNMGQQMSGPESSNR